MITKINDHYKEMAIKSLEISISSELKQLRATTKSALTLIGAGNKKAHKDRVLKYVEDVKLVLEKLPDPIDGVVEILFNNKESLTNLSKDEFKTLLSSIISNTFDLNNLVGSLVNSIDIG